MTPGRGRHRGLRSAATFLAGIALAGQAAQAQTIYVDGKLKDDCKGNYSIAKRDASGGDGDAYNTIVEAANRAKAGDVVLIREGVYNSAKSLEENDILWPKNSGEPGKPIVFRPHGNEKVILGDTGADRPAEDEQSIARAVVTMKGVRHIAVEGLRIRKAAGWLFVRQCDHIAFRNCVFEDALHNAKGTARLIECTHCKFLNCTFRNSSFDSLQMEKSDRNVVEGCVFSTAAHTLIAIRGGSYNVVRDCRFDNPYFEKKRAEKLIEVYDIKPDKRGADNPAHIEGAAYDGTKYNLFEGNFFGYHPFRPNSGAQPSAMQYSGQCGIIRRNVFCNPPLKKPDPDYPEGVAGGAGVCMRWGGSWEGWNEKKQCWIGEGHEAGYVAHNRIFSNTFFGYDNGCVTVPSDDAMDKTMNPPPLHHKNPTEQFHKKFEFADNVFKNNVFVPAAYTAHINWAYQQRITGKPVAVVMRGLLGAVRYESNAFFAPGESKDDLIYVHTPKYAPPGNPAAMEKQYPGTFAGNVQRDPAFEGAEEKDFRLKEGSPMVDAGAFLTAAVGAGKDSTTMQVKDAGFFFDGFGIEGEKGDSIQLQESAAIARIVAVDYAKNTLTLDKPLSWEGGQGVSLPYAGRGPDIGAHERGGQSEAVGPKAK